MLSRETITEEWVDEGIGYNIYKTDSSGCGSKELQRYRKKRWFGKGDSGCYNKSTPPTNLVGWGIKLKLRKVYKVD